MSLVPSGSRAVPQPFVSRQTTSSSTTATSPRRTLPAKPNFSSTTTSSEEERDLREFVQQMVLRKCPGCDEDAEPFKVDDVFCHTEQILISEKDYHIFRCNNTSCRIYFCPGCSQTSRTTMVPVPPSAITTSTGTSTGTSASTSKWCCPSARLFHIFLLLCGPTAHPKDAQASILQDHQVKVKVNSYGAPEAAPDREIALRNPYRSAGAATGTGYDVSGCHTGFGGYFHGDLGEKSVRLLPELFAALREAWPSAANASEFDRNPSQLLLAMARRSPLMIKVAELFRDDCMEEVMRRAALYHAMFDFIQVVAAHPFSAPLVCDLRNEYPIAKTLLPVCFGTAHLLGPPTPVMKQTYSSILKGKGKAQEWYEPPLDTLQSLANLLSSLTVQSRAVMRYLDAKTQDTAETLAMCRRICEVADELQYRTVYAADDTNVPGASLPSSSSGASTATGPDNVREKALENMRTWLNEHKVAEIITENWLDAYSFCDDLGGTAASALRPGRLKRIIYELSMLQTSLPEGIFVRHDGARLDAMKVLFVGPAGTPYENGLFEFDMFCPLEYPHVPPLTKFKTTQSGRKFNPNLYTNGKVCLSLLGTWSGENWSPQTSTLLQLLVSIQAMIFCANPLWNEPEMAGFLDARASDLYNWEMRSDTLVFAMSDWLSKRETSASGGLWGDVVGKHFRLSWRRILETAIRWEEENDPAVSFSASRLGFIMPGKCAATRFPEGIRKLKGHFAEWARTEEEMALVKVGLEEKTPAVTEVTQQVDQEMYDLSYGSDSDSDPDSAGSLDSDLDA